MAGQTLYQKRIRLWETFVQAAVYGAVSVSLMVLASVAGYVLQGGLGVLSRQFLTTASSALARTAGIGGNLVNTVCVAALTLAAAVPVGVGAAVYLNEYAGTGRTAALAELATETMAGVPSVIFGLFGMTFFGETLGLGYSLLTGALTLALMVLPLIVRSTQEALRAVPESMRDAALGLGASRWYMIRTVLLPASRPGIRSGVILAAGRILGESAALLFTAGSGRRLPASGGGVFGFLRQLAGKIRESGGTLSVELYLQLQDGRYDTACGIGCVLLLAVFGLNFLMKLAAGGRRGFRQEGP